MTVFLRAINNKIFTILKRGNKMSNEEIEQIIEDFCDNYCKYREQWDGDDELSESDICRNCPLDRFIEER